jgi:hypothetical protein
MKPPAKDYSGHFAAMLKAQVDFVESGNSKPAPRRSIKTMISYKKRKTTAPRMNL